MTEFTKRPSLTEEQLIEAFDREVQDLEDRFLDGVDLGPSRFAAGYILGSAYRSADRATMHAWLKLLQRRTGLDDEFIAIEIIGG